MEPIWITVLSSLLTTIVGIVVTDIIVHLKLSGKKVKERHKQERIEEVKAALEPELKMLDTKITSAVEAIADIKNNDIPLLAEANKSSLRNQLLNAYTYCIRNGYRSVEDMENWSHLYDAYRALKGNGMIERLNREFEEIPTEAEYKKLQANKINNKR